MLKKKRQVVARRDEEKGKYVKRREYIRVKEREKERMRWIVARKRRSMTCARGVALSRPRRDITLNQNGCRGVARVW